MTDRGDDMHFNLQWLQVGLLCLTLLFGVGQYFGRRDVGTVEQQRRIEQQERQLEKLADNLNAMQATIASQNTSVVLLQAQGNETKGRIDKLTDRIEAIATAVGAAKPIP